MKRLFKLDSFISEKIWGGFKLNKFKNLGLDSKIGETYEVSTHKSGNSKIADKELSHFLDLSYLIKFIDTSDNLSIQVHPDDSYAKAHENDRGKLEAWIILEAQEGAGLYLGFKDGVTKKELKNALAAKLDISQFLNFIQVKAGDFFILPEGLVHAIGKGVTLCEIQQSSGVTYRVWDWNRVDDQGHSRELHIDKALDVLKFNEDFNRNYGKVQKENLLEKTELTQLIKHNDFEADLMNIPGDKEIELNLVKGESIVILQGSGMIDGEAYKDYESYIAIEPVMIKINSKQFTSLVITR
jgi:mannose-6-phosphate isomerase